MNKKVLEYGPYLLIFLLPLQTRWMIKLGELNGGYWEYGTYSLYGTDLLLIGLLIFIFIDKGVRLLAGSRTPKQVWWFIGALELFVFISIFFAPDKPLALYGYGRFVLGIGLFFLLAQIKYDKIKLYWSIVFAGAVQSLLAWQQFCTQSVFASKWLGMASQRAQDLGVSVVESGGERWLRAYGSLPHPNILGGFFAIVLLVNIILYFNLWQEKKYKVGLLLSLIFFVINFTGLLLTFSRSAWLGFAVGALTLTLSRSFFAGEGIKQNLIVLLKFFFIIIAVGSLFFYFFRGPILSRVNVDSRLENKSLAERAAYNHEAWQIIQNHRLFGIGIKNYGLGVYNEIDATQPAYAYQPAHNVFLLVWAEIGIFGLICFLVFLFSGFVILWRRRNLEALALLTALIVIMCFDHWLWSLSFGIYLFWLVIGITHTAKLDIRN